MYYSLKNPRPAQSAPHGTRYRKKLQLRYDERGCKFLAVVGQEDQYASIQSYADATDINNIVRRATMAGTLDQLAGGGVYTDATKLPSSLAESFELFKTCESLYNAMNDEQRAPYPNFKAFINSFGSMDGAAKFVRSVLPQKSPVKEVDNNES